MHKVFVRWVTTRGSLFTIKNMWCTASRDNLQLLPILLHCMWLLVKHLCTVSSLKVNCIWNDREKYFFLSADECSVDSIRRHSDGYSCLWLQGCAAYGIPVERAGFHHRALAIKWPSRTRSLSRSPEIQVTHGTDSLLSVTIYSIDPGHVRQYPRVYIWPATYSKMRMLMRVMPWGNTVDFHS